MFWEEMGRVGFLRCDGLKFWNCQLPGRKKPGAFSWHSGFQWANMEGFINDRKLGFHNHANLKWWSCQTQACTLPNTNMFVLDSFSFKLGSFQPETVMDINAKGEMLTRKPKRREATFSEQIIQSRSVTSQIISWCFATLFGPLFLGRCIWTLAFFTLLPGRKARLRELGAARGGGNLAIGRVPVMAQILGNTWEHVGSDDRLWHTMIHSHINSIIITYNSIYNHIIYNTTSNQWFDVFLLNKWSLKQFLSWPLTWADGEVSPFCGKIWCDMSPTCVSSYDINETRNQPHWYPGLSRKSRNAAENDGRWWDFKVPI